MNRSLALFAAVALSACLSYAAQNGDQPTTVGGSRKPRGGGGGSATAGLPAELQGTKFTEYPGGLRSMPEHAGAHGIARISGPKQGIAVAFLTPAAGSGGCTIAETSAVQHDDACNIYVWVSEAGSHAPIKGCLEGPLMPRVVRVDWTSAPPAGQKPGCVLKPAKPYYCNYTATGFDRGATRCDMAFASPLSQMDNMMGR